VGLDGFSFDRILTCCNIYIFKFSYFYNAEKEIYMHKMIYKCMNGIFLFLCHHDEYSYGFLHTVKIIHLGLKVYDAIIIFLFSFLMQC
jgi:hypothetical protein